MYRDAAYRTPGNRVEEGGWGTSSLKRGGKGVHVRKRETVTITHAQIRSLIVRTSRRRSRAKLFIVARRQGKGGGYKTTVDDIWRRETYIKKTLWIKNSLLCTGKCSLS